MPDSHRRWSDLSPRQRRLLVAAAAVEVTLTTAALVDMTRRPSSGLRGSKLVWFPAVFVQPVGPIAYFVWGIRRGQPVAAAG